MLSTLHKNSDPRKNVSSVRVLELHAEMYPLSLRHCPPPLSEASTCVGSMDFYKPEPGSTQIPGSALKIAINFALMSRMRKVADLSILP